MNSSISRRCSKMLVSMVLLFSSISTVFFYMLLLLHHHEDLFGTKLLTQQHPKELSDDNLFYLHCFTPHIKCSAEIMYNTSNMFIPQQLLLCTMDINPNPGSTPHCSEDFSSLQQFNDYKCTSTKITQQEFHLKTYQYYLHVKFVPKGLQPKLRPAIEPVSTANSRLSFLPDLLRVTHCHIFNF